MNKRLLTAISLITAFLVLAFFTGQQNNGKKHKVPTVGILQLVTHPALDQIHQGVVAGLQAGGYKDGQNVHIKYQNAQGNQANLKTMAQNFANQDIDLSVGITTPAALSLEKATGQGTPLILAGITDPVGSHLAKSNDKPGMNVTGIAGDSPYEKQATVMQEVMPKAKTVGIVSTSSDHAGTYHAKNMTKLLEKRGYKVKNYTIASTNDMQQVATTMMSQVDVVYAPQDNGVATAMKILVSAGKKAGVPVFPAADTMVKDGGVASYAESQYEIGYQAGRRAARVLKGESAKNIPIESITKGTYVVNKESAADFGLTIPDQIMQAAQAHGEVY
ncbi:tryptophan ABC transporter substrate-binding protein [Leuconostocaceae bacterium ESL0958]|nr:tryptophan ABC transporter substrate-binding protein [Leuconostocaceae bacterium ESL0958]